MDGGRPVRPWRRPRGEHVAAAVIADGREPTDDEARHLGTCARCFADVRRGRSFDRQLGEAVAGLPSPSIQPEVLTVAMPPIRRPSVPSFTSLGVIAALVVAAGLVTWTVLPRTEGAASARPSEPPDAHLVIVGDQTWRIGLAGRTLEVHRSAGTGSAEELLASWDLGEFVNGGATASLRCPRVDGGWQWAVFGHRGDDPHPLTYSGPAASWTWAPDGVWLVVLDMTTFNPADRVEMKDSGARAVAGMTKFAEYPSDIRQPSGCFISG
jgi:hypothetical protein